MMTTVLMLAQQQGPMQTHLDRVLTFALLMGFIVLAAVILIFASQTARWHR